MIAVCGHIGKRYSSYASGILYGAVPIGAYYLYFYFTRVLKQNNGYDYIKGCIYGGLLWIAFIMLLYPVHYYWRQT
jgi:hypothetical protein